ncbi:MAG: M28 family peptidase [Promethearchaeota archaeon]
MSDNNQKPVIVKRLETIAQLDPFHIIFRFIKSIFKIWHSKIVARSFLNFSFYPKPKFKIPNSSEIFSWISELCATPHRRPGTPEGHRGEQWIENKLKELGLKEINKDSIPIIEWSAENWSLKVNNSEIPSFYVVNTRFTENNSIEAPLVFVGKGKSKNFKKVDVRDKIVVAEVPFPYMPVGILLKILKILGIALYISDPENKLNIKSGQYLNFVRKNFIGGTASKNAPKNDVYWQSYKRGAKAVLLILKDQPSNSNSHYGPYDGIMKPIPALWIGKYDGIKLKEYAKKNVNARIILEGKKRPSVMHNIWGILPGKSDEIIMITSHHDSPFKGAVEDASGVAQVLAQIKIWSQIPLELRKKTLLFVISAGHFYGSLGAHMFARNHPEIMKKVKLLITLEHLGGIEVVEKNKQYTKTKNLALTVMFTSAEPLTIAIITNALKKKPAKLTIPLPYELLSPAPTSDAAGYVIEAGVPVISWIGCPYYLLDEYDTTEMIKKNELKPICETVTELVAQAIYFNSKIE